MPPQFSNMTELTSYLGVLEERIRKLEQENQNLKLQNESLNHFVQEMGGDAQKMLPKTGLISPNFLQRSFTVWGHYFVAQLIISIPIACIYMVIMYFAIQQGISILPTP